MIQKFAKPPDPTQGSWWGRPCGGRDVLGLALPLVISAMSFTIMHFCDRMFLAWHSTSEMAAASMAGSLNWTVFGFPLGLAVYANTFVAQYHGANSPKKIGAVVWQAARIGVYASPFFAIAAYFSPQLFEFFGHPAGLLKFEVTYFRVLAWASAAVVISASLASFFIGRGKTRPVMIVNIAAAILNIVLDYWWIFGGWGIPAMGIEGAAWATVVSQWFKVASFLTIMFATSSIEQYGLVSGMRFDRKLFGRLFYYGGPNGLQFVIEGFAFTVIFLMIGRLGETQAAATSVALNINMMAFVPMIGMGGAVSTLVGQQIGRGNPSLASRATWTGCWLALVYTSIFGALYLLLPQMFVALHHLHADNFDEISASATLLLRFVAAYCLFDSIQIIFVSAIKGAGDTRFVLITTIITSTGFVLAGMIGGAYFNWGLISWWALITGWITVLALVYLARFMQGHWQTMRVIEPELIDGEKELAAEVPIA